MVPRRVRPAKRKRPEDVPEKDEHKSDDEEKLVIMNRSQRITEVDSEKRRMSEKPGDEEESISECESNDEMSMHIEEVDPGIAIHHHFTPLKRARTVARSTPILKMMTTECDRESKEQQKEQERHCLSSMGDRILIYGDDSNSRAKHSRDTRRIPLKSPLSLSSSSKKIHKNESRITSRFFRSALDFEEPTQTPDMSRMMMDDHINEPRMNSDFRNSLRSSRSCESNDSFPRTPGKIEQIRPIRNYWDLPTKHDRKISVFDVIVPELKKRNEHIHTVEPGHENEVRRFCQGSASLIYSEFAHDLDEHVNEVRSKGERCFGDQRDSAFPFQLCPVNEQIYQDRKNKDQKRTVRSSSNFSNVIIDESLHNCFRMICHDESRRAEFKMDERSNIKGFLEISKFKDQYCLINDDIFRNMKDSFGRTEIWEPLAHSVYAEAVESILNDPFEDGDFGKPSKINPFAFYYDSFGLNHRLIREGIPDCDSDENKHRNTRSLIPAQRLPLGSVIYGKYEVRTLKSEYAGDTSTLNKAGTIRHLIFKPNSMECFQHQKQYAERGSRWFLSDFANMMSLRRCDIKAINIYYEMNWYEYSNPVSRIICRGYGSFKDIHQMAELYNNDHDQRHHKLVIQQYCDNNRESRKMNHCQIEALQSTLKFPVTLISGPPGTGKTTTISRIVDCYLQPELSQRSAILCCAFTNAAADNILAGLLKLLMPSENTLINPDDIDHGIIRVGSQDKTPAQLKRYHWRNQVNSKVKQLQNHGDRRPSEILKRKVKEDLFRDARVIVGTVYSAHFNRGIFQYCHPFRLVIVDEASQVFGPLLLMVINRCNPDTRFVLVGDSKQLPPVIKSDETDLELMYRRKCCLFDELQQPLSYEAQKQVFKEDAQPEGMIGSPFRIARLPGKPTVFGCLVTFLDTQYRMRRSIADFASSCFYDSMLLSGDCIRSLEDDSQSRKMLARVKSYFGKKVGRKLLRLESIPAMIFVNLEDSKDEKTECGSRKNTVEARLVAELLLHLFEMDTPSCEIGVISPYSAQTKEIRKYLRNDSELRSSMTRKDKVSGWMDTLMMGTVDKFQGNEKSTIIYSTCNVSQPDSKHFGNVKRLNVAITRAQRSLIMFGNRQAIEHCTIEPWRKLVEHCDCHLSAVSSDLLRNRSL